MVVSDGMNSIKQIDENDINDKVATDRKRNIERNINKSNLQISHDKNFISHKRHIKSKSLTIQLSDKIAKEALIIELRRELNYHIKFQKIYKNYFFSKRFLLGISIFSNR